MMNNRAKHHISCESIKQQTGPNMIGWSSEHPKKDSAHNTNFENSFQHVVFFIKENKERNQNHDKGDGVQSDMSKIAMQEVH